MFFRLGLMLLFGIAYTGTIARPENPPVQNADPGQKPEAPNKRKPNFTIGKETTYVTGPIDKDGYIAGGPELIVEVSASSASYDLHQKMQVYRRHGVKEYIVWRVLDAAVDWFMLRNDQYERLETDDGIYRSPQFPGLWLDASALIAGDIAKVLDVLRLGMASIRP